MLHSNSDAEVLCLLAASHDLSLYHHINLVVSLPFTAVFPLHHCTLGAPKVLVWLRSLCTSYVVHVVLPCYLPAEGKHQHIQFLECSVLFVILPDMVCQIWIEIPPVSLPSLICGHSCHSPFVTGMSLVLVPSQHAIPLFPALDVCRQFYKPTLNFKMLQFGFTGLALFMINFQNFLGPSRPFLRISFRNLLLTVFIFFCMISFVCYFKALYWFQAWSIISLGSSLVMLCRWNQQASFLVSMSCLASSSHQILWCSFRGSLKSLLSFILPFASWTHCVQLFIEDWSSPHACISCTISISDRHGFLVLLLTLGTAFHPSAIVIVLSCFFMLALGHRISCTRNVPVLLPLCSKKAGI